MIVSTKSVNRNIPNFIPLYSTKYPMISDSRFRQIKRSPLGFSQGGDQEDNEGHRLDDDSPAGNKTPDQRAPWA